MFNKFLCQNKFVIEKHIKFIIKTSTHAIIIYKKTMQGYINEESYKNSILKINLIYMKLKKNHRWIILAKFIWKHIHK